MAGGKIWGDLTMLAGRIRGLQAAVNPDEPTRFDQAGTGGGAVSSVAGKTGAVTLVHTDITDFSSHAIAPGQRGANNGVAPLDADGKIPKGHIPLIALAQPFVVNSEAAQLALTAEEGDIVVRTDQTKTYIHNSGIAGTMADYTELLFPSGGSVISVNAKTGIVVLTAADISGIATAGKTGSYTDLIDKPDHINRRVYVNNAASGNVTINWANYDVAVMVLTGNVTLAFSGATPEQGCILRLKQDGTGGRTVTLPNSVRYGASLTGYAPSSAAGVADRVGFIYDSIDNKYDLVSTIKGLT